MQERDEGHSDCRDSQRHHVAHGKYAGPVLVGDVLADDAVVQRDLSEDGHHHEERHHQQRPAIERRCGEEQRNLHQADADHQRLHVIAAH